MTAADIASLLGGRPVLGREVRTEEDLKAEVSLGLPSGSLGHVAAELHPTMSLSSIYALVGSARTLQRRRQNQTRLTAAESTRLVRLAHVAAKAREALGATDRANHWLVTPNRALGGRQPVELLDTDADAAVVTDVLGRIEHGVFG